MDKDKDMRYWKRSQEKIWNTLNDQGEEINRLRKENEELKKRLKDENKELKGRIIRLENTLK